MSDLACNEAMDMGVEGGREYNEVQANSEVGRCHCKRTGRRGLRVSSRLLQACLSLAAVAALFCCAEVSAQTTVTISNAVETPGIDRPGINLGGIASYGSQQLLKSLNYATGGYFPGTYAATTYQCSSGGSNTTTSWYNNISDPNGYPANFWAGASFVAINSATGTSYGSGVVTASTSGMGSTGITFTLSPGISSACNPSQNDVLILRLTAPNTLISPNQLLSGHICTAATWDTTDTSPSSTNTQQSLEMPNGCGLTFYIDATVANRTNTNPALQNQQANFINLNGSYNATFKAKCLTSGCSVNFGLGRLGGITYVGNTTVNPSYSPTPGAGWTTYNYPFTASETNPPGQTMSYSFSCTGVCLLQDADVIEGSALPGNTTAFRDAVVSELQKIHPGSIRYMDASQWCADVADEIASTGNRRWCGVSSWGPGVGQPLGYNDVLALGNFIGSDVLISVGALNQPSDWTMLINWLNSSGWISTYANAGHTIYLEDGNEAWNSGVGGTLYFGNGTAYGYTLGPNMAAAKAASGYNPNVIKLVGNSWVAGSQGYGPFGWIRNTLTVAQGTPNGLPDFMDDAPYMLNYLGNYDTSGGNVATTGAPFLDEWAEDANIDSVTSPPLYTESMYLNQQYAKSQFGVNTLVYEVNESTNQGIPASQLQLDQIDASVGNALATAQHVLLMQRDSHVTGPIHVFTLAEPYTGYSCNSCAPGTVMPLWGANLAMATGPAQTPGIANTDRPLAIALEVINNAIGSNGNLMSITQAGTPTFYYPGGQQQGSSNSISPNSAVPYVNCFSYSNGSSAWTTICFNNNLTTAESVTLAGAGAPTGSVSELVFPGPSNVITDHNENTYLGASSIPPVVTYPSPTTASGTSYTIPPASMIALTYTVGGTPTLATPAFSPGTGSYAGAQTVTINFPSGSTGCVGINTIPTAPTPGTCGSGGATYTGPITVSASETVNAIATETGSNNSAVGTATYTLSMPAAAVPTFSPTGGTYTSSQPVTISDATAGTTIYYTTNGTTPTTSSSVYGGPITVSASETLEAIAVENGYTTSSAASAVYTINTVLPAPSFSPAGGTYTSSQPVTISDATAGTTIYYTTNGTAPTTSSSIYSGPITVSASETLEAIAVQTGYTASPAASAVYTINPVLSPPTFSPAGGTYSGPQPVSISATAGTTIYYTTNGITPTTSSSVYSGPITVSASETLEAIAVENGYTTSSAGSAAYTINPINTGATTYISLGSGQFTPSSFYLNGGSTVTGGALQVTDGLFNEVRSAWFKTEVPVTNFVTDFTFQLVNASADGMTFTIQAQGPTALGNYGGGLGYGGIGNSVAIKFDLFNNSGEGSNSTGLYTGGATPTVPAVDLSSTGINLHSGDLMDAHMVYDGTNLTMTLTDLVTTASVVEVFPVNIPAAVGGSTAYVGFTGGTGTFTAAQNILTWSYTSQGGGSGTVATPTFSPAAGTYSTAQQVTLNDATAGSTIYYTTDGTTPTTSSSVYGGPITVSATQTLQAIAVASGYTTSPAATAVYTISPVLPTPTLSPAGGTYTSSQPVTISDATAGTTIYYTTNGTTPTTSSSVYGGPITVSASETLEAIAVENGYTTSSAASAVYTINTVLPAPSFSPAGGTYTSSQPVTISDATAGTTIYYTTNGTAPTTSSSIYSGPITVSASETLEAIAVQTGYTASPAASAVYTINPVLSPPTFSPAGGTYSGPQPVSISATAGTTIYYTTNGITPTTSSSVYSGPITVSASETLEAIAVENGYTTSSAGSAAYTINPINTGATTYISLGSGQFTPSSFYLNGGSTVTGGALQVTDGLFNEVRSAWFKTEVPVTNFVTDFTFQLVNASADGMTFTIQAQGPTALGNYGGGLGYGGIGNSVAIKFDLFNNSGEGSNSTGLYTGGATPTVPAVDLSSTGINLHSGDLMDAHMVYDGTNLTMTLTDLVTTASVVEVFPVNIPAAVGGSTAYVGFTGGTGTFTAAQNILTWSYTSQGGGSGTVATPTFSPAAGTYSTAQQVTLNDATAGSTIYYTTDGTTPTTSSSVYGGPITVSATQTLQAIAVASGYTTSPAATAAYTISPVLPAPTLSPAGGTYTSSQQVTISDAVSGSTIYYTTNGTTPTTSSSIYSGPITVSASETLEAIAVQIGYTTSPTATAAYTISGGSTGDTTYISFGSGQFAPAYFYLNGGSTVTGGALQITDGGYGENRSAWFAAEVPIGNFTTDFTFQLTDANADGMTFAIQAQSPYALGGSGGSLGYQGIPNSVAVKFDLYDNSGEGRDSTGLYTGGAAPMMPAINLSSTGINLHSGDIMRAHMVYDGTNLTMTLTDTATAASVVEIFPVNIPAAVGGNTAYVGFTGGTGGLSATQDVLSWSYATGH
jgi:Chitobiase/beta-hexosaminidase C-terminal domain/Legume lectin domain/Bacterial lectin